uniref:Myb/SANT-like DNA-binding domain-containing protein n=1 Tax=Arundo donax TaxID=35708 RepID=A0A0A9EAJ9_ARUDO
MSDDDEHGVNEDATDSQTGKGKKGSAWHRMKWTDSMVKLLITAVSYTGEDPGVDLGGRRNCAMMQKKGKWRAISKVMGERGCLVSPQQCEDKFNDLNKRYKRLTDILGRGTTCKVVEKPELLEGMNNISDKMKDDARKILNSKHLFYEEMCSYHNNNRISLPADPALQRSLQVALRSKDEHDARRRASGDADEDEQSADTDYEEENDDEHHTEHVKKGAPPMHKRTRHMVDQEDVGFGNSSSSHDCSRRSEPHSITVDINKVFPDGNNLALVQKDLAVQSAEIEKQRMQIEVEALDLAKQRLKWERFSKKKDRELEKMRLENEQMKIENKRLELELRHKELELELKLKGNGNHA